LLKILGQTVVAVNLPPFLPEPHSHDAFHQVLVHRVSPTTGTNATRPSCRGHGITSCACPHQWT
jgi:hypothetical protein